jgi:hypothetical protein
VLYTKRNPRLENNSVKGHAAAKAVKLFVNKKRRFSASKFQARD